MVSLLLHTFNPCWKQSVESLEINHFDNLDPELRWKSLILPSICLSSNVNAISLNNFGCLRWLIPGVSKYNKASDLRFLSRSLWAVILNGVELLRPSTVSWIEMDFYLAFGVAFLISFCSANGISWKWGSGKSDLESIVSDVWRLEQRSDPVIPGSLNSGL
jgi:hypothetical protein